MDQLLTDSFEQLLEGECDLPRVRRIEAGEAADGLWESIRESGFADALVAEEAGGAGLTAAELGGLLFACGRHALPLPLAQTMVVRRALHEASLEVPEGPITLADRVEIAADGRIRCLGVPFARTSEWVLAAAGREALLLPVEGARLTDSAGFRSLSADLEWDARPAQTQALEGGRDWRAVGAALTAAMMAGAMERIAEMTIGFANDRKQFGRPIGKFQAIQQQISVLAEQLYAARSAALLGLSDDFGVCRAAAAKSRVGEAAVLLASISHGVHGAMGITEEFDLQMFTRRLYEGRLAYGSEAYWNERLDEIALDSGDKPLDFIRDRLAWQA